MRTGHHANRSRNLLCRPGDDDIPGVAHSRGRRTAISLVCFRTLDVLVASHLRWRKIAEFHVCASTTAQRGNGGIWTTLTPARSYCDTGFDLLSADAPPRLDVAAGAFWRLRRVRALARVCARQTRPHVTMRCHLELPFASPHGTELKLAYMAREGS